MRNLGWSSLAYKMWFFRAEKDKSQLMLEIDNVLGQLDGALKAKVIFLPFVSNLRLKAP